MNLDRLSSPGGSSSGMLPHVAHPPPSFLHLELARHHQYLLPSPPMMMPRQSLDTSSSSSDGKDTPEQTPMSKTNQYKKIMKPLLERKRRARINKCLDELKEIMTVALQAQGENVSKLEKADILELTVQHLQKMERAKKLLRRTSSSHDPLEELSRFQAGYTSCAHEAASFLSSAPGVDARVGQRLLEHLNSSNASASSPFLTPSPPRRRLPSSTDSSPSEVKTPDNKSPDLFQSKVKKEPDDDSVWRPF